MQPHKDFEPTDDEACKCSICTDVGAGLHSCPFGFSVELCKVETRFGQKARCWRCINAHCLVEHSDSRLLYNPLGNIGRPFPVGFTKISRICHEGNCGPDAVGLALERVRPQQIFTAEQVRAHVAYHLLLFGFQYAEVWDGMMPATRDRPRQRISHDISLEETPWGIYCRRVGEDGASWSFLEMQAAATVYNCTIIVFRSDGPQLRFNPMLRSEPTERTSERSRDILWFHRSPGHMVALRCVDEITVRIKDIIRYAYPGPYRGGAMRGDSV